MSNIKNDAIVTDSSLTNAHRVVILDSAGNTILNTTIDHLINYFIPRAGDGGLVYDLPGSNQIPSNYKFKGGSPTQNYGFSYSQLLAQLTHDIGAPPPTASPPVNLVPPSITDIPIVGVPISATSGSWSGNPVPTITGQWYANDVIIAGQTSYAHVPLSGELGKELTFKETAVNTQGSAQSTSQATPLVADPQIADVTATVYASMLDGAVIALASPGVTLSGSHPGVSIKSTGDLYISDRTAFLAALPMIVHTSGLSYGLTLSANDYYVFDDLAANMTAWFDATDHRNLLVDEVSNVVVEWRDKNDVLRAARNDVYPTKRPTYVTVSAAGNGHSSVSFDPLDTSVYGLFFPGSPLYSGLQRLTFSSTVKMEVRWDLMYDPNVLSQTKKAWPAMDMQTNLTVAKMSFMTIIAEKASNTIKYRVNGTDIDVGNFDPGYTVAHDSVSFVVFFADNAGFNNTSQLFSQAALGNAWSWKNAGFRGDIFEIMSITEAVPAA